MKPEEFFQKLRESPRPVVVDLWASWCGPCRVVKPILERLAGEYAGRVDLWQNSSDDHQELLRELRVYGIPTLIAYRNGVEVQRYVGAKPALLLRSLFESLAAGGIPASAGLASGERILRLGAGLALVGVGWLNQLNLFWIVLGGLVAFSGVYDRCPIWRAVTAKLKSLSGKA